VAIEQCYGCAHKCTGRVVLGTTVWASLHDGKEQLAAAGMSHAESGLSIWKMSLLPAPVGPPCGGHGNSASI
jgi:hypothetical protein